MKEIEKEKARHFGVFILVLIPTLFSYHGDYWNAKWAVFLWLLSMLLGVTVYKKLKSIPAALLTAWVSIMAIFVFGWNTNFYQFLPNQRWAIEASSAYSFSAFLLILFTCLNLSARMSARILVAFSHLCLISSAWVFIRYAVYGSTSLGGFFDQASMEGCFIAITYPIVIGRPSNPTKTFGFKVRCFIEVFLPPLALLLILYSSKASQPIAVLGVTSALYFILKAYPEKLPIHFKIALISVIGVLGAALAFKLNPEFINSNGRFQVYQGVLKFMSQSNPFLSFGLGTGTFQPWATLLKDGGYFRVSSTQQIPWLHSDFLQTFFENGAIGLFLLIWVGVEAFFKMIKTESYWIAFSLFAYGLTMLFNMPFHYTTHAFLGMFLLTTSLRS